MLVILGLRSTLPDKRLLVLCIQVPTSIAPNGLDQEITIVNNKLFNVYYI